MKKLILLVMAALLLAFTAPVLAGDGYLEWTADKTITLTETFTYSQDVTFRGSGAYEFTGEAWAKIQEQQELFNNFATHPLNDNSTVLAVGSANTSISASYVDGSGVANVNQSAGNLNNQGNEVAISVAQKGIAFDSGAAAGTYQGLFCEAQVVSVQYNGIRYDPVEGRLPGGNNYNGGVFLKRDAINTSFANFTGVVNINEAAGDLNNQGNAVAVAAGIIQTTSTGVDPNSVTVKAASHVMLAQNNANNLLRDASVTVQDGMRNSFTSASGVFDANQAAGNMNNQKNAVALSFNAR